MTQGVEQKEDNVVATKDLSLIQLLKSLYMFSLHSRWDKLNNMSE